MSHSLFKAAAAACVFAAAVGLTVQGCSSDDDGGSSVGAGLTLEVTSVSPPDFSTGLPTTSIVRAIFNRPLDPASLSGGAISLSDAAGLVPGNVNYDATTRSVTFVPDNPLTFQTLHRFVIANTVRAATAGVQWNGGLSEFTTGTVSDTTPPTFSGVTALVPDNARTVRLSWNLANDDLNGPGHIAYRIYRATTLSGQNFTQPVGITGPGASFFFDEGLTASTQYFYVVRAVDTTGNEETNTTELSITTPAPLSWANDVYPLFVLPGAQDCTAVGCHAANSAEGGLTLTPIATAHAELVGVLSQADGGCSPLNRVEPGAPLDSHLFQKLSGTHTCGSLMPRDAVAFNSTQLDTIADWIVEGAQNN